MLFRSRPMQHNHVPPTSQPSLDLPGFLQSHVQPSYPRAVFFASATAMAAHLDPRPHFHLGFFQAILPKRARGAVIKHKPNHFCLCFISFPRRKRQTPHRGPRDPPWWSLPVLRIRSLSHSLIQDTFTEGLSRTVFRPWGQ